MELPTKDWLARQARRMKNETGKTISQCYEALAQQHGFKTYAAMRSEMKARGLI